MQDPFTSCGRTDCDAGINVNSVHLIGQYSRAKYPSGIPFPNWYKSKVLEGFGGTPKLEIEGAEISFFPDFNISSIKKEEILKI